MPTPSGTTRFHVVTPVGSGGMASVDLAVESRPGGFRRGVALKRIHPHLADDAELVDLFLEEARLSAAITHPNVCAVHDFGQNERGEWFLAMEYLVGVTCGTIRQAATPARVGTRAWQRAVAHLLAEACEGLHAIHEARGPGGVSLAIVHRDVTPQNLFVTFDGGVKVMDLGIAKAMDRTSRTRTGELRGSLGYVSPEHVRGEELDRRSDLFSLGVTGWELFTGHRLFKRSGTAETIYAVLGGPIEPIETYAPNIPTVLSVCMSDALNRDPKGRPATARAMADRLRAALREMGGAPSRSEVEAWLGEIFPGVEAGKREQLRAALAQAPAPELPRELPVDTSDLESAPASSRSWSRGVLLSLGALCLLGIGVALGGYVQGYGSLTRAPPRDLGPGVSHATPSLAGPAPPVPMVAARPAVEATTTGDSGARESDAGAPALASESASEPAPARTRPSRHSRRSPAAEATRTGVVTVVVPGGWAAVYEGGRLLGQTPLRTSLPEGPRTLDVRVGGVAPGRSVRVEVSATHPTPVVVRP